MTNPSKRLDPRVFKIPIDRIRAGYYSDKYFTRFVEVLRKKQHFPNVLYQFFPRKDACVVGLDEAAAILHSCTGFYRDQHTANDLFSRILDIERQLQAVAYDVDRQKMETLFREKWDLRERLNENWQSGWNELEVHALHDGDLAKKDEIILTVRGNPALFGYLETVLLGVISRASSTATAVKKVVRAAGGKPVMFFSARFDHYWVQATDGYAALKAGAFGVSTDANADYWGTESLGTIPHALIASFGGDTFSAAQAFDECISPNVQRMVLVDWDNDCIGTTLDVISRLYQQQTGKLFKPWASDPSPVIGPGKGKIWAVRFDTSGSLRDRSVVPQGKFSLGVCPELVWRARKEFDRLGAKDLKIMVTGGFDAEKIALFEEMDVPADLYGVGSSLLKEKIDCTADIVEVAGKPCAKVGRGKGDLSRLERVFAG